MFMIKNKKTLLTVNTIVFFVIPCIFVEDKKILYSFYGVFLILQIYLLFFFKSSSQNLNKLTR